MKIQNCIATSEDYGKIVALALLDLSVAFYTVDQSILHDCPKDWFDVDVTILVWINSYLINCKQKEN